MGKERRKFFNSLPSAITAPPVDVVKIDNRLVGVGQPVFVIAEVGANHRGKMENALKAIEIAAHAGVDAVKFQHLKHDDIAADTVVYDEWNGKGIGRLSDFYKHADLPYEWTAKLVAHAKKHKIMFLSTPFDKEAVDILDKAGVPAFKIASYELTDDILLRYVAKKGKPIILSTGMAYLDEVAHAVRVIQEEGNNQIILLHCVSIYPPKSFSDLNLRAIQTLREAFNLPVGYSDHSKPPYYAAPIAAVALGACVIEKHLTDERSGGSNDDPNSMEPREIKRVIEEIRMTELAISGSGIKQPVSYRGHKGDEVADRWARRTLYAKCDISRGQVIGEDDVISLRPYGGIETRFMDVVVGSKAVRDIKARAPITWNDLLQK